MSTFDFRQTLRGISSVPVTAYDSDGAINCDITAEVYARVAKAGIHNIVAAGNTGEFYALTRRNPESLRGCNQGCGRRRPVTAAI